MNIFICYASVGVGESSIGSRARLTLPVPFQSLIAQQGTRYILSYTYTNNSILVCVCSLVNFALQNCTAFLLQGTTACRRYGLDFRMCILDNAGHERSRRREVKPPRNQGLLWPNGSNIFSELTVSHIYRSA